MQKDLNVALRTFPCNFVNVQFYIRRVLCSVIVHVCVSVAIAMDDAKGSVGSGHLPDWTSKPFTTEAGFAVPGTHSEGIGVRFTHA